jgi:heme A synthase
MGENRLQKPLFLYTVLVVAQGLFGAFFDTFCGKNIHGR